MKNFWEMNRLQAELVLLFKGPELSIDKMGGLLTSRINLIQLKEHYLFEKSLQSNPIIKTLPKIPPKTIELQMYFILCVCIPNIIWVWTNYNGIMHFIYLFMQNICFLIYVVTEQAFLRINTGMLLNNNVFSHELNWSWEFGFLLFYYFFSYYFYWFLFLLY